MKVRIGKTAADYRAERRCDINAYNPPALPLDPGTRIGPYEIVARIGAGGMGEVYRARDAKLNRDVAVKVLPHNFAADVDRLARFTREAQMLASLNHANIAHIHGVEELSGAPVLVMELVDGEDLAQRIARGPIPLDEAIPIARQIAEALEAAHERGIVHRDLKPANIKLRADGVVKVLDFGLARAIQGSGEPASSNASLSPTFTSPAAMTAMGMIIGTAAYMAPEQAKGKEVDKRADIWAFGVVLCEMLTARPVFDGETVTEVLAAVMLKPPDLAALPHEVPSNIRRLIDRCLEKDPRLRLRDIGEARVALAPSSSATVWHADPSHAETAAPGGNVTRWLSVAAAVLAIALATTGWFLWRATRTAPSGAVTRFDVRPPEKAALALAARPNVALSPDGSTLAFVASADGVQRLYVRARDATEPRAIPGTEGASNPVFSPDGTEIAFFAAASLRKTRLDGSASKVVDGGAVDASTSNMDPRGATWLPDGTIVYSPVAAGPLYRVAAIGGKPEPLTHLVEAKDERTHRWPSSLPGGKAVLFTVGTLGTPDNYDDATIEAVEVATGERHTVMRGAASARYVPTGHLLFMRGAILYAIGFDPDRFSTSGSPVPVADGVNGDTTTGAAHLAVANDGTLAYMPGSGQAGVNQLMWLDRQNVAKALPLPTGLFFDPQISPDGTQATVVWETVASGNGGDVWVTDFARNTFTRLSFSGSTSTPMWSQDGKTIYYVYLDPSGRRSDILRMPADGSRHAETVVSIDSLVYLNGISSDGNSALLTYRQRVAGTGRDNVVKIPLAKGGKVEPLVATAFDEYGGAWSPDGRFLAYQADESGRYEIYVRSIADGGRWQVSTTGGEEPHWSRDGRELFYRNDTRFMAVAIASQPTFTPKAPVMLFDGTYNLRSDSGVSFAVDPHTNRFLMIRPAGNENGSSQIRIVLNWFSELRRLTAAAR